MQRPGATIQPGQSATGFAGCQKLKRGGSGAWGKRLGHGAGADPCQEHTATEILDHIGLFRATAPKFPLPDQLPGRAPALHQSLSIANTGNQAAAISHGLHRAQLVSDGRGGTGHRTPAFALELLHPLQFEQLLQGTGSIKPPQLPPGIASDAPALQLPPIPAGQHRGVDTAAATNPANQGCGLKTVVSGSTIEEDIGGCPCPQDVVAGFTKRQDRLRGRADLIGASAPHGQQRIIGWEAPPGGRNRDVVSLRASIAGAVLKSDAQKIQTCGTDQRRHGLGIVGSV